MSASFRQFDNLLAIPANRYLLACYYSNNYKNNMIYLFVYISIFIRIYPTIFLYLRIVRSVSSAATTTILSTATGPLAAEKVAETAEKTLGLCRGKGQARNQKDS